MPQYLGEGGANHQMFAQDGFNVGLWFCLSCGGYQRYSFEVKAEIVRTRNRTLFPHLKIPRTTISSWLSARAKILKGSTFNVEVERKIQFLEAQIERERALRTLLEEVRRIFPFDFKLTRVKNKNIQKRLVHAIGKAAQFQTLKICLKTIRVTPRMYYRWSASPRVCRFSIKHCQKKHPNELTGQEIAKLKKYVTSKKYAHICIYSLCLLAQRSGDLFCSVDTWYKYKKIYGWRRPNRERQKVRLDVGLRARRANELWHIDITYIPLGSGRRVYLQTVVDNYSRYLISWRLSHSISSLNTVKSLQAAKAAALLSAGVEVTSVVMDGGSENTNGKVLRFIESSNMRRIIARADIRSSNSMVEAFFRSLKNNFLYHRKYLTFEDLERKLRFYFRQYNEIVPHSAFLGPTPREMFVGEWTEMASRQLAERREVALIERRSIGRVGCGAC